MTLHITQERMGPHMLKVHVPGLGVLHHFTQPDHGPHHDHPWPFRSTILKGGYVEEQLLPDGTTRTIGRRIGDHFIIDADHVHRIIALPAGECWTCIEVLGPKTQEPAFYEWRDSAMLRRQHDSAEWIRQAVTP